MTSRVCSDDVSPFTYNDIITIVIMYTSKPFLYTEYDDTRNTTDELSFGGGGGEDRNERYNRTLRLGHTTKYEDMYLRYAFRAVKGQRDKIAIYTTCFHAEYKPLQFLQNANYHVIICEYFLYA